MMQERAKSKARSELNDMDALKGALEGLESNHDALDASLEDLFKKRAGAKKSAGGAAPHKRVTSRKGRERAL